MLMSSLYCNALTNAFIMSQTGIHYSPPTLSASRHELAENIKPGKLVSLQGNTAGIIIFQITILIPPLQKFLVAR